jgi:hypothetical protein
VFAAHSANLAAFAVAQGWTDSAEILAEIRKLPRQADSSIGDFSADEGLGRNVNGGTRPRLSWGRSAL